MKAQEALDEQSLVRGLTRTDVERSLAVFSTSFIVLMPQILSIARAESSSKSPLKTPSPSRKIDVGPIWFLFLTCEDQNPKVVTYQGILLLL